jgi:non-ribosomal peptide synthase protein (TIGR01720 family)
VTILAGDAPAAREELLQHIQDIQADFVLDTAPQLRMVHVDRPAEGRKQLLVIAHHLVIDAFSWRVLEEDIETLYRQAADGAPLRLPDKTCPYKEWVENLEALRQQGYWQRDIGYWQAVTGQASQMASVQQAGRSGEVKSRVVHVSESASRALESEAHQAFNTNAQDFLVAALAQAFADVGRHRPLALMLESHGRDSIDDALDVSRTIGWFTNLYPVTVTLPDADDPVIVLKAVKEHLRAAGGKGMGFGVLSYLGEDTPSMEEPSVCFNYLGRFAGGEAASRWVQVSEDVDLAQEGCRSPRQHRLFDIELLALQTESRFQLKLVFDTGCLGADEAVALCAAFEQRLAAMIDACGRTRGGLTPSDVPDIDLGQQELDDLLLELDAYAGNA